MDEKYYKKDMEIAAQICEFQKRNSELEIEIALNNKEISELELQRANLRHLANNTD